MPVQNLRIGWLGFHQEGIPALRGLKESGIHLEAVITLDEAGVAQRSAIADYAGVVDGWDIPLHLIRNINDAASLGLLHSLRLDLLFVIGWSQILKRDALAAAKIGVVGAHASLLPHNRGSAPINWSLIRGEAVTGNTLIWLTEDVDALWQKVAYPTYSPHPCPPAHSPTTALPPPHSEIPRTWQRSRGAQGIAEGSMGPYDARIHRPP